jgi:hypothetical protein
MGEQQLEAGRRTRRAVLAAAAGSAAALAATAMAGPATVLGHDAQDVQKEVDNPTTAATSITNSTAGPENAPTDAFAGVSKASGTGVHGFSGDSTSALDEPIGLTGVLGSAVGESGTGVTGFGEITVTLNTVGVVGDADNGVVGLGTFGVVGVGSAVSVQGLTQFGFPGAVALWGEAADTDQYALRALGRVKFERSGRALVASGKSSVKITLAAVTSATHVFAQIGSLRPGYYIASVVPTSGSFTVYFNKPLVQGTYVHWFVLDV